MSDPYGPAGPVFSSPKTSAEAPSQSPFDFLPVETIIHILDFVLRDQLTDSIQKYYRTLGGLVLVCSWWRRIIEEESSFLDVILLDPMVPFAFLEKQLGRSSSSTLSIISQGPPLSELTRLTMLHAPRWRSLHLAADTDLHIPLAEVMSVTMPQLEYCSSIISTEGAAKSLLEQLGAHRPPKLSQLRLRGAIDVARGVEHGAFRALVCLDLAATYDQPIPSCGDLSRLLNENPELERFSLVVYSHPSEYSERLPSDDNTAIALPRLRRFRLLGPGLKTQNLLQRLHAPLCQMMHAELDASDTWSSSLNASCLPSHISRLLSAKHCILLKWIAPRGGRGFRSGWQVMDDTRAIRLFVRDVKGATALSCVVSICRAIQSNIHIPSLSGWSGIDAPSLLGLNRLRYLVVDVQDDFLFWAFLKSEMEEDLPKLKLRYLGIRIPTNPYKSFNKAVEVEVLSMMHPYCPLRNNVTSFQIEIIGMVGPAG